MALNLISPITRRHIFDFIRVEGIFYAGRLDEIDFLSRIFDLSKLPSDDKRFEDASGDIWQHRINNPDDWPDDWIYYDSRFNLLNCDDSIFLQFLSEMLHPLVRTDTTETKRLVQIFNDSLKVDGFEIVEKTRISDRPIYCGRRILVGTESLQQRSRVISEKLNASYVTQQINLMESAIDNAPHVSIGIAKELIETCCKNILEECQVDIDRTWDLMQLVKRTHKELKLLPGDIPDDKKAVKTIRTILSSLSAVVHGICELRNDYGSGHGKSSQFRGLNARHAKLAVGAATTLAIFLLETHDIK